MMMARMVAGMIWFMTGSSAIGNAASRVAACRVIGAGLRVSLRSGSFRAYEHFTTGFFKHLGGLAGRTHGGRR
jgi:hypothetical protein